MSTTIDQRVVSLQFDNKQFERNTATTMSTLDKLKEKLTFNKTSKGLEDVGRAAKKVDLSGLSIGIEQVSAKFSALQVIGVTALANITNSAINAGKKWVKALSVDQISAGWDKFSKKTTSVATLKAQGFALEEVNDQLDRLNWFTDETSYNYTEMVDNIAKFTATGKGLTESVNAMEGIATWAALSGQNAATASRAMYQLSQAMGAGVMRKEDYKSIQNASMDTDEFRQKALDAAVALGTLKKNSDGTYKSLRATGSGAAKFTKTQFTERLTEGQWFTADVMMRVFEEYSSAVDEIYEVTEQTGKLASEVIDEIHKKAESENISINEAIKSLGYNFDEFALKAFEAGQKARTFSDAIDSVKDAVSTGWMTTFELIFGDADKATELWTELANTLWDVFAAGAEVRNWVIKTALYFAEPWKNISEKLGNVQKVASGVTKTLEYFQDVVDKVWLGKFNNWGDNPDRRDLLRKAGYDPKVVQYLVNLGEEAHKAGKTYKLTVEDVQKAHKKYGLEVKTTAEDMTVALDELTDEQLTAAGLTEDEISLFRALAKQSKRTGRSISDLAKEMSEIDGRTLLIDSFKNLGSVILDVVQIIKDALGEVFEIPTAADMVVKLYNAIKAFNKFTESIRLTNRETGELTTAGQRFMDIFKGIFAVVDMVLTIIRGPANIAFIVLKKLLKVFGVSILDSLANAGDKLVEFRDGFNNVVDTITKFITDNVEKWIEKLREVEFFKTVAKWFEDASEKMSGAFDNVSNKLNGFQSSSVITGFSKVYEFISGIIDGLRSNKVVIAIIDGIRTAFGNLRTFFAGFKLPEFNLDNLLTFLNNFITLGNNIKSSDQNGVSGVLNGIGKTLNTKFVTPKATKFATNIESFFAGFIDFWLKVGDKLKIAFKVAKDIGMEIAEFIFGTKDINLPVIMDAVEKFLWIALLFKAIQALETFTAPLTNITDALNNFASSLKWDAIANTFKSMAIALGVLTICILVLSSIDDMNKAWQAAGILSGLMVVMAGLIVALGWLSGKMGGLDIKGVFGVALSLMLLVGAIALLVRTLKEIDGLKLENPVRTWSTLAGTLLALTVGVRMIAKAGGADFKSIAAILTLVAALKLILEVITAYDEFDWVGKSHAISKMMEMMLGISIAANIASRGLKAGSNAKGMALMILAMVVALKLLLGSIEDFAAMPDDELEKGGRVVVRLLGILTVMAFALSKASGGTVLEKGQRSINHFTGLAVALLAVIAAIWLLGRMDIDTLKQGGLAVGQVLILFSVMLAAIGKSCSGLKMGPIIAILIGFGILMFEMAEIVKYLDAVSWESKISSAIALGVLLLAMSFALRSIGKANVDISILYKWSLAMLVLGTVVVMLGSVLKSMNGIDSASSIGNAIALGILLGAMAIVLKSTVKVIDSFDSRKLSYKKMAKIGVILLGLTGLLYAFTGVFAFMNGITGANAVSNAIALSILLAALVEVAKHLVPAITAFDSRKLTYKKLAKIGIMLLGLTVVLAALAGVLILANKINPDGLLPKVVALSALLTAVAGVLLALNAFKVKFNGGAVAAMALLSAVLYELVGVLLVLQYVNPDGMLPKVTALSVLLSGVAGVLLVLNKFKVKFNGGAVAAMALLSAVLYELVGVLYLLGYIKSDGLLPKVLALSALMAVIAGVLLVLNKFKVKFNGGAVAAMALLGLVLAELAGVLILANKINPDGLLPKVVALSVLISVLTLLLLPLTLVGTFGGQAIAGVATLAVLSASLFILVGVLSSMEGLENATANAKTLTLMATVLTLLLLPLTLVGALIAPALLGVAALSVLMTSLLIIVGVLALMEGLENAKTNTQLILELLSALTTTLVVASVLAPLAVVGVSALAALALLVGKIALFVVAIGALMDRRPEIEDFVDNGIELFKKLFRGVGEMLSEFGVGLTSGLPDIATNLSKFAENLSTFIDTIDSVSEDTVKKAGWLAEAILKLTTGDFMNTLSELFGKKESLGNLGTELSSFATNAATFISSMNDMSPEGASTLETFCSAVNTLNDACDNVNITDGTLSTLGSNLDSFAGSMKSVSEAFEDFTDDDVDNIKRGATAATSIAELNKFIPRSGGVWQDIAGEADLAAWGKKIDAFADSLVNFSIKVSGKNIDKDAIVTASEAAVSISELNSGIPKSGGVWQSIAGEADLANWGKKIVAFADSLITYSNKVTGKTIDKEAIIRSCEAATELAKVNDAIPESDGVWQWLTGEKDLTNFGSGLITLADGIVHYATEAVKIDDTKIAAISKTGDAITKLKEVCELLPKSGGVPGKLWGDKDPASFGAGLASLSSGISQYCAVAEIIDQSDIDAIEFTKQAVNKLEEVVSEVDDIDLTKTANIKTASVDLKSFCQTINAISIGGYDYSGISGIKTAVTDMNTLVTNINTNALKTNFANLSTASTSISTISTNIAGLNDKSYGGVAVLDAAIDDLADIDIDGAIAAFSGKSDSLKTSIDSIVTVMTDSFSGELPKTRMINAILTLVNAGIDAVGTRSDASKTAGIDFASAVASGISSMDSILTVTSACQVIGDNAVKAISNAISNVSKIGRSAGISLATGFGSGISIQTWYPVAMATAMANAAEKAAKEALDVNSPSKVFRKIGMSVPEGFAMGIDKLGNMVVDSSRNMASTAINSVSKSISRIGDMVSSDIDAQPTIRPVMDLSDVRAGANTIGNLLNTESSIGVVANAGRIGGMMNRYSQNRGNDDVVAAIDKLNKRMDNLGNTTNIVNGITYDDGSNINNAVATLVRAAKIERRV